MLCESELARLNHGVVGDGGDGSMKSTSNCSYVVTVHGEATLRMLGQHYSVYGITGDKLTLEQCPVESYPDCLSHQYSRCISPQVLSPPSLHLS